jgi:hypothetical protein
MLGHFEMTPTFLAHLSQGRRLHLLEIMAPAVEWVVPPAFSFAAGSTPEGMRRSRGILISRRWVDAMEIGPCFGDQGRAKQLCDVMARSARPTRSCNMCSNATRYSIGPDGAISRNSLVGV